MSVAITSAVNYNLKPTSVKASRKQVVIPSSNKTSFSPEETAVFYLPSLRNNVMDGQSGYLRFTLNVTAGTAGLSGYLDGSAHSLISRIMTYLSGGQLGSDLQNYGVLANLMQDLQLSQSEKLGLSNLLGTEDIYGTVSITTSSTNTSGAAVAITVPNNSNVLTSGTGAANNGGTTIATVNNSNRQGLPIVTGTQYTFCIPLLHPLFTLSEKMWPAFAFADDTRLEITWSSVASGLVQVGGTVIQCTIDNPEIFVDYIEFDSPVFSLIQQTYAGRDLVIPSQDYRFYASLIASNTAGQISQIIPAKQQSARAMFFTFRPTETQSAGAYTNISRINPFWSANDSFRLNIGGISYPQRPIQTRVQGNFSSWMASTQTALHAFNNLSMNGCISRSYYQTWSAQGGYVAGNSSYQNAFCVGINLDTQRGQSETQNSGLSLANVTTYYEGFLAVAPRNTGNNLQSVSVDCFVLHDVMFVVDSSGNCSVKF